MKRIILSLVTTSFLATSGAVASTNAELEAKLKILEEQMAEIKKELTKTNTTLTKPKVHSMKSKHTMRLTTSNGVWTLETA